MEILYKILVDKRNRRELISKFQEMIWDAEVKNDLLSQLAYDLDFYEPDKKLRIEDNSFYGDIELENLIEEVLQKIN